MSSAQYIEWRAGVANGHLEDAGAREERRDGCSRGFGYARCRVAVERNRDPLPRRRDRRGGPAVRRTARCAPQPANRESAGRLLHDGRLSGVSGPDRRGAAPGVPHAGRGRHARRVRRPGRSGMIASATATCAVDVAVLGAGPAGIGAAVAAHAAGCSVLLIDEAPAAGGQIYRMVPDALLPARHGAGDTDPDRRAGDAFPPLHRTVPERSRLSPNVRCTVPQAALPGGCALLGCCRPTSGSADLQVILLFPGLNVGRTLDFDGPTAGHLNIERTPTRASPYRHPRGRCPENRASVHAATHLHDRRTARPGRDRPATLGQLTTCTASKSLPVTVRTPPSGSSESGKIRRIVYPCCVRVRPMSRNTVRGSTWVAMSTS